MLLDGHDSGSSLGENPITHRDIKCSVYDETFGKYRIEMADQMKGSLD